MRAVCLRRGFLGHCGKDGEGVGGWRSVKYRVRVWGVTQKLSRPLAVPLGLPAVQRGCGAPESSESVTNRHKTRTKEEEGSKALTGA